MADGDADDIVTVALHLAEETESVPIATLCETFLATVDVVLKALATCSTLLVDEQRAAFSKRLNVPEMDKADVAGDGEPMDLESPPPRVVLLPSLSTTDNAVEYANLTYSPAAEQEQSEGLPTHHPVVEDTALKDLHEAPSRQNADVVMENASQQHSNDNDAFRAAPLITTTSSLQPPPLNTSILPSPLPHPHPGENKDTLALDGNLSTTTIPAPKASSKPSVSRHISKTPCTLFVGNLDTQVTEVILAELFLQCGAIDDVLIPTDPQGVSKGFGFVEYCDEVAVPYACALLDGVRLFTRAIRVRPALQD